MIKSKWGQGAMSGKRDVRKKNAFFARGKREKVIRAREGVGKVCREGGKTKVLARERDR